MGLVTCHTYKTRRVSQSPTVPLKDFHINQEHASHTKTSPCETHTIMMSSHKRSVSQSEDPSALPNKSAKFSASPDTEQLLALAWSENQGLRNHIAELYGFIDNSGLALGIDYRLSPLSDHR